MSIFSSWSYTAKATFWTPTLDAFGQPASYTRVVRDCTFHAGGKQALDDVGEEFAPKTTIYLEAAVGSAPAPGDIVSLEDSSASTPPAGAETVRAVQRYDPSTFLEGDPDYKVMTG